MKGIDREAGPLSRELFEKAITSLPLLLEWIKALPYGRNSDRSDYSLILKEDCGTCSTKHAFVKAVAIENEWDEVALCMGFFRMNAINTPKVATVLLQNSLTEIPEAHTYLRVNDTYTDLTGITSTITENDIEEEMEIEPEDIGMLKEVLHKGYITQWKEEQNVNYTAEEIWNIREECIKALSKV